MEYKRISADCHIDLCWMPPEVFVSEATPAMKSRMPYVTDGPDGPYWTSKNGTSFGLKNGVGPAGQKYVPGQHARADLMAATNLYEDDQDGGPFFMCGPGDPEDFLYRGTRNPDGTRNGDQISLINKLTGTGANSIYFQAIRSHGGDGKADHNPFNGSDPVQGVNVTILDQWETWFTEMDDNGIVIYFFFYDDAINVSASLGWPLDGSGNLHPQEKNFLETLVNRFEHHQNLIWVVMEEVQEMGSDSPARAPSTPRVGMSLPNRIGRVECFLSAAMGSFLLFSSAPVCSWNGFRR